MNRVLVLLLCVFLVGCGQQTPDRPLYSGSDGIILSFPQSNALQQYTNTRFTLSTRLYNDGAHSVTEQNPGVLTVSFDPSLLRIDTVASSSQRIVQPDILVVRGQEPSYARALFSTLGRSQSVFTGESAFVDFTFTARELTENRQQATVPVVFQLCYPYQTVFTTSLCVDQAVNRAVGSTACTAQTLYAQPQGAPVAVTQVVPRYTRINSSISAQYEFTVQNLRQGIVYSPSMKSSLEACDLSKLENQRYGVADFTAELSGVKLLCGFTPSGVRTEEGTLRFDRSQARITCTLPDGTRFQSGESFFAPITVTIKYFYIQSQTAQVEVRRS